MMNEIIMGLNKLPYFFFNKFLNSQLYRKNITKRKKREREFLCRLN